MIETEKFLSIKEASRWASRHIGKDVTPSNITYLKMLKWSENQYDNRWKRLY